MTHPEESYSGLQSGRGSLNHPNQKVNTVHESITQRGELTAPRDAAVCLIQATNLSDSQIMGNLLDSAEKEILTLVIHFFHAGISSSSVIHKQQARNARMEMNLSHRTISFYASGLPASSYLFPNSFVFLSNPVLKNHAGRLVILLSFIRCHKF